MPQLFQTEIDNAQATAVHSKDAILQRLNDLADCDNRAFRDGAAQLVDTIDLTVGMFAELSYCYKATEILNRIFDRTRNRILATPHTQTVLMLTELEMQIMRVANNVTFTSEKLRQ